MALFAIIVAIILIVSAVRNTQATLFTALETDVPEFGRWFLAIIVIGAIGYVPVFRKPARALLLLILVVLFVKNGQAIVNGVKDANAPKMPSSGSTGATSSPSVTPQSFITNVENNAFSALHL